MNLKYTYQLREPIQALLQEASRINSYKPQKYWYPLSMATYDTEEILAAVDSLCSFRTTMWEKTSEFERQFAYVVGCPEAIMVNSGSSADLLIAFALINPQTKFLNQGDEILVPSVTWPTQLWSPMMAGLKVRFVDTDPNTLNMDLNDIEAKIGPKTRAISLVHLMGNPCDMDRVMAICQKHNLILIEDCCEALGAGFKGKSVGTFGLAGSFSFFFSHHITTMEGGMIICHDQPLSDLFRLLRAHGWARNAKYIKPESKEGLDPRYMFLNWGFNVRPTELQAGFGLEQLRRLPAFNAQRLQNVAYFQKYLNRHSAIMRLMEVLPDAECSWFALPIMLTPECPFKKEELLAYLEEQGVETRPIVAGNLTRQPVCQLYPELQESNLPGADAVHDRGFYLGLHPFEATKNLDRLAETFEQFIRRYI
ncbi:MAG: GDP-4-keto-6-deoxy-D-mannose-3-dehydratase / pyridoxamine-phosphate transaminase [Syntrophomonadaceae bacterium]|nr:GDP-4-keto-6-deoxy-D-mannose-3-dehydratase / pyridoxamine-phosphate transaminase [Bacillota bacterium]